MPFLACLLLLIFSDFCCVLGIFSIYKSTLSKWCFYGFAEAVGGIRVFWWVLMAVFGGGSVALFWGVLGRALGCVLFGRGRCVPCFRVLGSLVCVWALQGDSPLFLRTRPHFC